MSAPQVKILQAPNLEELEAKINEWYRKADDEGLSIDYLGEVHVLPDGVIYTMIDYHELLDADEEEHHG